MIPRIRVFVGCAQLGYWESSRQRLFASLALYLALAILVAVLGKELSIRQDEKILKDFGLAAMEMLAVFYALIGGSSILASEMEQKSFYFVLSRPTSRFSFLVGKFTGMAAAQLVNLLGLFGILWATLAYIDVPVDARLLVAVLGIAFQALLVGAITTALSVFTSPPIAMVFAFASYIAGRWSDVIRGANEIAPETPKLLWEALYLALPNYRYMDFKALAVYGDLLPVEHLLSVAAYAVCYTAIALSIAVLGFERKDLR